LILKQVRTYYIYMTTERIAHDKLIQSNSKKTKFKT